jgi:hypothetical protein
MSEWMAIPGWEGYYEASIHGEIRSLDRTTTIGQRVKGKVLVPGLMPNGYLMVSLYRGSARHAETVHRLVMAATHGPCPDGFEVCHRNGKRNDNRRVNLYYGTRSENNLDKVRHGTDHNAVKTHCKQGHEFTPDNTYWRQEGGRTCRTCRARWQRESEKRQRAKR